MLLRNVVVDDLQKRQIAIVTHSVKGLRLDRGVLRSLPFHILLLQLCVRSGLGLLGNGLDGLRAVDGLLGTGNSCQTDDNPDISSTTLCAPESKKPYVCLIQFIAVEVCA